MLRTNRAEEAVMSEFWPIFLFLSAGCIALFSFIGVVVWSASRRREREAYYKSETIRKIAEMQGEGATSALEFLREQDRNAARRGREGLKLSGLITAAVGAGLITFLQAIEPNEPVYLAGLIPFLVGAVLLAYAYFLAPKE